MKLVLLVLRVIAHYVPAVYEAWIGMRNWLLTGMYLWIAKPLLFLIDPERIHRYFQTIGRLLNSNFITRRFVHWAFYFESKKLLSQVLSLRTALPHCRFATSSCS